MALREIGARLILEGESEWKSQLNSANREMKNLKSELAAAEAEFKGQANSVEALTVKQKTLASMHEQQTEKVSALRQALSDAEDAYGENSRQADDLRQKYNYARRDLANLDAEIAENADLLGEASSSADGCATSIDGYGHKVKTSKGVTGDLTEALDKLGIKSVGSAGAIGAVSAVVKKYFDYCSQAVEQTLEFREGLAKLDVAAQAVGTSFGDDLSDALGDIYSLTGEMDSSIEALSNLLAADFSGGKGMTAAIEALSGAIIEFPDTLKIEGLADSLQETLATGKATGQFEEMLGRVGVDVDAFSASLEDCSTKADRQNLILHTLADTGLSEVSRAYKDANKDLIAYRVAEYELQISQANLGNAFQGVVTALTQARTAFNNFMSDFTLHGVGMYSAIGSLALNAGTSFGQMQAYLRTTSQSWTEYIAAVNESGMTQREYWDSLQDGISAEAAHAEVIEASTSAIQEQAPAVENALSALDALQAQYDAIRSSVDSAVSGFNDMTGATEEYATTADDMIAALQSQQEYLASYRENLKTASEMGLSDALIEELSDGSAQSAAYLKAIVDGGESSIDDLNEAFAGVQSGKELFVQTVSSMLPEFQETLDGITSTLQGAVHDWNQYDKATTAGENTISGLLTSLSARNDEILAAGKAAGEAFMSGYNSAMGISSPSRRMMKAMDYTVDGALIESQRRANDMISAGASLGSAYERGFGRRTIGIDAVDGSADGASGAVSKNVTLNVYTTEMSEGRMQQIVRMINNELGAMA